MSHTNYSFNFLDTISEQLERELTLLSETLLTNVSLGALRLFQVESGCSQGVYVIYYEGAPVYVGKANDVAGRLTQHLLKLTGRLNVNFAALAYKALLLDKSMSTAANETLLINKFKQSYEMWNNAGLGAKDPGKERDTTEPSKFDRDFPINSNWQIQLDATDNTVRKVLEAVKRQVPFLFRFQLEDGKGELEMDPTEMPGTAIEILQTIVDKLGIGWKGVVLSYGMILYKTDRKYPYGVEIMPDNQA